MAHVSNDYEYREGKDSIGYHHVNTIKIYTSKKEEENIHPNEQEIILLDRYHDREKLNLDDTDKKYIEIQTDKKEEQQKNIFRGNNNKKKHNDLFRYLLAKIHGGTYPFWVVVILEYFHHENKEIDSIKSGKYNDEDNQNDQPLLL